MNYFTQILIIQKTLRTLEDSLRGTGRTTSVLDSVKNGDVLFVMTTNEMAQARQQLQVRNIKADVFAVGTEMRKVADILDGRKFNNIHFDHRVIEGIINRDVECLFKNIQWFVNCNEERKAEPDHKPYMPEYRVKS